MKTVSKQAFGSHWIRLSPRAHLPGWTMDGCVVSIGAFDGLHLGHRYLIQQLVQCALNAQKPSVVILFEPLPKAFFAAKRGEHILRMTYLRDQIEILKSWDVDAVWILTCDARLLELTAEAFVMRLCERLKPSAWVIGDDFRFGKERTGDVALLRSLGNTLRFKVYQSDTLEQDGRRVSSSRVRNSLIAGEFDEAAQGLGRPFSLLGRVVYGDQLGRTLGFPTLNIRLKHPFVLHGIYGVHVQRFDQASQEFPEIHKTSETSGIPEISPKPLYLGAASIGTRPAVKGRDLRLEVHLFDFSGSLYGEWVRVIFLGKIRDEANFDSLEALKAQIERDCEEVRHRWG